MPPFSIGCKVNSSVRPFCSVDDEGVGLGAREAGVRDRRPGARRAPSATSPASAATVTSFSGREAFQLEVRRQAEVLVEPLVRDHDAPLGVEHAQAVRHVVERGVEALGKQRHVARRDHRVEQREAQPLGDEFHRQEEGHEQAGEDPVIDVAVQQQRGGHRHPGAENLHDDGARVAEVAPEDADHVGDGDREADQVRERRRWCGRTRCSTRCRAARRRRPRPAT